MKKMINVVDDNNTKQVSNLPVGKRKPLQVLSGIFARRARSSWGHPNSNSSCVAIIMDSENAVEDKSCCGSGGGNMEEGDNDGWSTSEVGALEPREALHSPYHARTIDQDMENLRLSRQDNPYLQVLASRECLNEPEVEDCNIEYEEKQLMASTENLSGSRDPLTLAEVHARLVRSPPPILWTKGQSSEPSFSHLTSRVSVNGDDDCVFQFPPVSSHHMMSPTNSCRSSSGPARMSTSCRFLAPFDSGSRMMRDSNLEAVTGKFNLSPQPRRKPESKNRSYSSDLLS